MSVMPLLKELNGVLRAAHTRYHERNVFEESWWGFYPTEQGAIDAAAAFERQWGPGYDGTATVPVRDAEGWWVVRFRKFLNCGG